MNTVAITIPVWVFYLFIPYAIAEITNAVVSVYLLWLKRKVRKLEG